MQFGNLIGLILVNLVFQVPGLWAAGRMVLGKDRVTVRDAVMITGVYTVINVFIMGFIGQDVAGLIQLVTYLFVVKKYYETTWGKAAVVSIVMVLINIVVVMLLMGPGLFLYH